MSNPIPLTTRQIHRLERLPRYHEVVSRVDRPPIVSGPKGQLLRVRTDGHLEAVVRRVQSYLHVGG